MAKEYKDLVVGLDIGTAKVMVVVAEVMPGGELKLAGLGLAPSNGLKRGVVVNIDATVQSIQQALKEAELMADCKIIRVYTGITGAHIRGINSSGMVAIKDREVSAADVARVLETARAINISTDQRLLLVEPQEFVIDGQDVKEPIGMSGIRLEAKVHIVTGAQSAAENIIKCVRRCGLEVEQLMLNPLASSLSVLTEDERELGVALVDIGAGTTDVAIFTNGAIRHTSVIPIAGDLITSDIAMALRTPTKDAEDIKVESGYAKQLLADPDAQVEVPGLGDRGPRMLSRQALAGVIEPRVEEIFSRCIRSCASPASRKCFPAALCSPVVAASCPAWSSLVKTSFSNRCAGVFRNTPAPCPTWWRNRAQRPSWACSKKRGWHGCAASRWHKKMAP
jgi:cell division protein FtsA